MIRARTALLLAALAAACSEDAPADPGPLEIGIPGAPCSPFQDDPGGCAFAPVEDGDALPVMPGPGSYVTIYPSLRAAAIDPHEPEVDVTVTIDDFVLGAEEPAEPVDMRADGTRFVLWSVRVRLQAELCCFSCREGTVEAQLRDAQERSFRGAVRVRLARAECPDPDACCATADTCPAPLTALLCD